MSTLKVGAIRGVSASSDAITVANDGTATGNLTNRQGKNLVINGEMAVAQQATSSTSTGKKTVDRFGLSTAGVDEAMTQEQVDVSTGTTPYTLGFRKAFKVTNGNQTSGAGSSDRCIISTSLEAHDMALSGWNYTSPSSYITLTFWAKSSVAQTFYVAFTTQDGTSQRYSTPMTFSSTNTWTKFTYKIPGASGIQFDNNFDRGFQIFWTLFRGTDNTDNSFVINQWAAYDSAKRYPDYTTTWFTTNDATFELTGVQLEVGDVATDFEHQCYQYHLYRCYRYFVKASFTTLLGSASGQVSTPVIRYPVEMRGAASTYINYSGDNNFRNQNDGSTTTGFSTYNHHTYGFDTRSSNGSGNTIYSSTYFADAEI